ncbi:hypothetical protein MMC29_007038, partial [Sticta canariensis]|nr:hypothetical protein [Sticta canariensis]
SSPVAKPWQDGLQAQMVAWWASSPIGKLRRGGLQAQSGNFGRVEEVKQQVGNAVPSWPFESSTAYPAGLLSPPQPIRLTTGNGENLSPSDRRTDESIFGTISTPNTPPIQTTFHCKPQENDKYNVKRILELKGQNYLVNWKGYP